MRERARRERSRPPWFLLTGLLLGLAAGLAFSIWWWPVPYDFAAPSDLNPEARDQYRLAIARAYLASSDSGRAYPRLNLLKETDQAAAIGAQAQRSLASRNEKDSQALAFLAAGLDPSLRPSQVVEEIGPPEVIPTLQLETTSTPQGLPDEPTLITTPEPGTLEPTFPPINIPAAEIPRVTPTLFPTLSAPFVLKERAVICDPKSPALLQIWLENAAGQSLPGVRIQIAWKDGEETFFTGLKADIDSGYADYQMSPQVTYSLRVGENGETIADLETADCAAEGRPDLAGGIVLRFTER